MPTPQEERERLALAIADGVAIDWGRIGAEGVLSPHEIRTLHGLEALRLRAPGFPGEGLVPGKVVGDFRLLALIGQGGMGQVWEAEQVSLGKRHVAVKFVRPERVTERQLELFAREARAGGRLHHPGIVTVHGYGQSDGLAWIAMEFVSGAWTLKDFLDEVTRASEVPAGYDRRAARIVAEIAEAMQTAHEAGVIHRDLKPQNVLIPAEGHPKVTDFGLARILDESALTQTGDFAGTYLYMSPEQVEARRAGVDHRTDVFSLGVVLYELLALRRPFEGDTIHQVAAQILSKDPPDPRTIRSKMPRDLAVIAGKALEKERDKRFQTMREFAADLRRFLADEPIHARPPTRLDRALKWVKRNPGKSSVAAIVAVTFTLIALLLLANIRTNRALSRERTNLASANTALQGKTTESEQRRITAEQEKERADREAEAAIRKADEVLRLSALQDLEDLLSEADELWPAHPENISTYAAWIQEARKRVAELPLHREQRAELRAKALPQPAEERRVERENHPDYPRWVELESERAKAAEAAAAAASEDGARVARERLSAIEEERSRLGARLDERRDWTFPEEEREARWWNNQLTKLIAGLEELERGLLSVDGTTEAHGWSLPKRLSFARALEAGFGRDGEHARAWSEALPAIRSAYPGLALTPQLGLVPLGPDPDSKLWEFAHLETGEPAARGADGKLVLTEATGLVFVLLPGGAFRMGAQTSDPGAANYDPQAQKDEAPVHEVTLAPFFLSKYEMTQGQWSRFAGRNPSVYQSEGETPRLVHPVEQVSWTTCTRVCAQLGLSLPSAAQWEYGARGGTRTVWWTGNERDALRGAVNLADQAAARADASWPDIKDWPDLDDGHSAHAPANEYAPNPFGLHNVHGNVCEWCLDGYKGDPYPQGATKDPLTEPEDCVLREYRGGSFYTAAVYARSANRSRCAPEFTSSEIGLRPARSIAP
jgi:serine/threonine protein kinase/formylglycine-generating enzyme required for sulfatase activity